MKVYKEIDPFDFLMNESWNCDNLKSAISENGVDEDQFNRFVEDLFEDKNVSFAELNDFLRFEVDYILEKLGIEV